MILRNTKSKLLVTEKAVKLKKDEYFIADLIGMKVVTEDGAVFGTLKDVWKQVQMMFISLKWKMSKRF